MSTFTQAEFRVTVARGVDLREVDDTMNMVRAVVCTMHDRGDEAFRWRYDPDTELFTFLSHDRAEHCYALLVCSFLITEFGGDNIAYSVERAREPEAAAAA